METFSDKVSYTVLRNNAYAILYALYFLYNAYKVRREEF